MISASALVLVLALTAPPGATEPSTPLLAYATSQTFPTLVDQAVHRRRLAQITHTIAKDPPPEADCARTLGASRFASMYDDLGATYSALGDAAQAAAAFAKAVSCRPRAFYLHALLADELLQLGRFDEARAEVRRSAHLEETSFTTDSLVARAAFSQRQWPEAIEHLRRAVSEAPDDVQATYFQCLLWLAQKRSGSATPALVSRTPAKLWPEPVLDFLQDHITETALVHVVERERDDRRRREILCEALFYTGEKYLAAHQVRQARRYFEATVHLQVYDFIEHSLAAAELAG
ncbi:MAG TPA: tetratricopeptide repeat protein [Steroidobacteraceae bacterium]